MTFWLGLFTQWRCGQGGVNQTQRQRQLRYFEGYMYLSFNCIIFGHNPAWSINSYKTTYGDIQTLRYYLFSTVIHWQISYPVFLIVSLECHAICTLISWCFVSDWHGARKASVCVCVHVGRCTRTCTCSGMQLFPYTGDLFKFEYYRAEGYIVDFCCINHCGIWWDVANQFQRVVVNGVTRMPIVKPGLCMITKFFLLALICWGKCENGYSNLPAAIGNIAKSDQVHQQHPLGTRVCQYRTHTVFPFRHSVCSQEVLSLHTHLYNYFLLDFTMYDRQ